MKKTVVIAALALGLTACSATSQTEPSKQSAGADNPTVASSSAAAPSGPGTYRALLGGAQVDVEIPGKADPEIEAALAKAGFMPGSWVTATVDNRQGQSAANVSVVGLSTAEGERVEYGRPESFLKGPKVNALPTAEYNELIALNNRLIKQVEAGEKRAIQLLSVKPLPQFVKADVAKGTGTEPMPLAKQS